MKSRIDNLEAKIPDNDPIEELKSIFKKFSAAYWIEEDVDKALAIRRTADPILKKNPELRSLQSLKPSQRMGIKKIFYIDYGRFIAFPETKTMERWQQESK